MLPSLQKYVLLVFLHIMMFSILQNSVIKACDDTVITACNDTTTCLHTYEEVYKLLGSNKNYFNIAKALYPAKRLPSVLVYVTLHGANGTENCRPAKYMWSMSCLFAAFPKYVLEVLSLGSILVTPRTEKLNITISPFCCNVSQEDRFTMVDTVLAALQDLAISPGIQDPSLNTVECIIKGHEPNLTDTGRSHYIIAILWLSFSFSLFLSFWLAMYALTAFDKVKPAIPAMYGALKWTSYFLLIVELGLFITALVLLAKSKTSDLKKHILPILIIVLLVGIILGIGCLILNRPKLDHCKSKSLKICIFVLAILTSHHFCWIVIGIMVNALWGVSVLLFVCVIIIILFFSLYNFFHSFEDNDNRCRLFLIFISLLTIWLSVLSLVAIVIVAGQTVFGRNTADDIVKTVILSVTIGFMKRILSTMKNEDTSKESKQKDKNNQKGKEKEGEMEEETTTLTPDAETPF